MLRNTTTTTLRAYFCEGFASSENLIKRLKPLKNLHSKHNRRSNVRRCELRRVLENRRDVVLEVRQRVRRNRSRRAQGAALVQGIIIIIILASFHSGFDHHFSSSPSLSLLTPLSLIQKARARDAVYFKATKYVKGSPEAAVITEVIPAEIPK